MTPRERGRRDFTMGVNVCPQFSTDAKQRQWVLGWKAARAKAEGVALETVRGFVVRHRAIETIRLHCRNNGRAFVFLEKETQRVCVRSKTEKSVDKLLASEDYEFLGLYVSPFDYGAVLADYHTWFSDNG